MPIETHIGVPTELEAGNTIRFSESLTDYPASEWSMAFVLFSEDGTPTAFAANDDGDNFLVEISAAQSANLVPGKYKWAEYVTDSGGERTTAQSGTLTVLPNLVAQGTPSTAQKLLTALEEAILKLSKGTNKTVNFNGQQFEKKDLGELLEQRTKLQAEVFREKQALYGKSAGGRIQNQFVSPYCS